MDERRVRVRVHGQVQGVFFRDATQRMAADLGVTGWVTNREDGTVEAEVQGAGRAVESMIAFVREGPQRAEVADVGIEDLDPVSDERAFEVR